MWNSLSVPEDDVIGADEDEVEGRLAADSIGGAPPPAVLRGLGGGAQGRGDAIEPKIPVLRHILRQRG